MSPALNSRLPSSPTPFTGYVITVPRDEIVVLPLTLDDALRFTVSGGVIVPESQHMPKPETAPAEPPKSIASPVATDD